MPTLRDLSMMRGNEWDVLPDHVKQAIMAKMMANPLMGATAIGGQQFQNPMLLAWGGQTDAMGPAQQAAYLAATGETIAGRRPQAAAVDKGAYMGGQGVRAGPPATGVVNPFYGWSPSQVSKYQSLIAAGVPPAVALKRVGR